MLQPLPLKSIDIHDAFFSSRVATARNTAIPYMWNALNDRIPGVAPSHCMENFRIAAGLEKGEFHGCCFQDSDLWKWVEGVAYSLATHPDPALEAQADEAIALAGKAQQSDGYLDTYYIVNGLDKRFTNLRDNHELYVAGHMFEAAAAYYAATGKRALLDIACRFADCLDREFGPGEHQKHGCPGHEEVELGLARLYEATGCERYLRLAAYFLDARGQTPNYFAQEAYARGDKPEMGWDHLPTFMYHQAHIPVREQSVAVGHAVRQGYLLAGMTEVGGLNGDTTLVDAASRVLDNIVDKQMYITGGVGATHVGEAYTIDYDLPPERCYNETCASISLIMTAVRMGRVRPNGRYGDVVERALYNGILSGVSLDGTKYFYMNPLEVWPQRCEHRQDMQIDDERQGWFGCACCPPNVLRTLTGLGQYLCAQGDGTLYIDQYVSSTLNAEGITLGMESGFPWDGRVTLTVRSVESGTHRLALRIPGWAKEHTITLNGDVASLPIENGYALLERAFVPGDTITLDFPMEVRFMHASQHTPNYVGKVAVTRGPLVYCLEEKDNGPELWNLSVRCGESCVRFEPELLCGVNVITCQGLRETTGAALYDDGAPVQSPATLTFVPYYAWGNRGKGEMTVWVRKA